MNETYKVAQTACMLGREALLKSSSNKSTESSGTQEQMAEAVSLLEFTECSIREEHGLTSLQNMQREGSRETTWKPVPQNSSKMKIETRGWLSYRMGSQSQLR